MLSIDVDSESDEPPIRNAHDSQKKRMKREMCNRPLSNNAKKCCQKKAVVNQASLS